MNTRGLLLMMLGLLLALASRKAPTAGRVILFGLGLFLLLFGGFGMLQA